MTSVLRPAMLAVENAVSWAVPVTAAICAEVRAATWLELRAMSLVPKAGSCTGAMPRT